MPRIFKKQANGGRSICTVALLLMMFLVGAAQADVGTGTQIPVGLGLSSLEAISGESGSGINALIEIVPLSYLMSPDIDNFSVTYDYVTEDVTGIGSWIPTGRAGVRFGSPNVDIDVTGGYGYLWNNAATGSFWLGDIAAHFRMKNNWSIGPHFGVLQFPDGLNWEGSYADVDFADTTGWMAGLVITGQWGSGFTLISVDYVSAEFDVETGSGWTANSDTLDISGIAAQIGIGWHF